MIRVLVADDEAMVRQGLTLILSAADDIAVVAEAGDGQQAVEMSLRLQPDVVLMDVKMPVEDGLSATRRLLCAATWPIHVVVLTTFGLDEHVADAMRLGASGFLLKTAPPRQLVPAVREAYLGETVVSSPVVRRLAERASQTEPARTVLLRQFAPLTARELEVTRLVARGLSNDEIAAQLVVAPVTVKTHVGRILAKLGVRDRTQLAVLAHESRLITTPRQL